MVINIIFFLIPSYKLKEEEVGCTNITKKTSNSHMKYFSVFSFPYFLNCVFLVLKSFPSEQRENLSALVRSVERCWIIMNTLIIDFGFVVGWFVGGGCFVFTIAIAIIMWKF